MPSLILIMIIVIIAISLPEICYTSSKLALIFTGIFVLLITWFAVTAATDFPEDHFETKTYPITIIDNRALSFINDDTINVLDHTNVIPSKTDLLEVKTLKINGMVEFTG